MPQSTIQFAQGFLRLSADTLTQRLGTRAPPPNHPLFSSPTYLKGQTAIVTGANTGIGLETTRQLAAAGATVVLACRNDSKAAVAADSIRAQIPEADLETATLDLSSPDSIRAFASLFGASRPLHVLVLNGGVMGTPKAAPETHFAVNHVGHALLTLLLMPQLAAARGRIVLVSSLTFVISDLYLDDLDFITRPYNWMTAYANSKLAMLLFMHALVRRLRGTGVDVNAVHPGEATSDVARNLGNVWMMLHKRVGSLFLLNTEESARTSVYVAGAEELRGTSAVTFHRICQPLGVPARFVGEQDVERLWGVTMERAGVTDEDLRGFLGVVRSAGGDEDLLKLRQTSRY